MNVMRFLGRFLDDGRLGPVAAVVILMVVTTLAVFLLPQWHLDEIVFFTPTSVHSPNVVMK